MLSNSSTKFKLCVPYQRHHKSFASVVRCSQVRQDVAVAPTTISSAHLLQCPFVGPQPRAGVDLPPPGGSTLCKPLHATVATTTSTFWSTCRRTASGCVANGLEPIGLEANTVELEVTEYANRFPGWCFTMELATDLK